MLEHVSIETNMHTMRPPVKTLHPSCSQPKKWSDHCWDVHSGDDWPPMPPSVVTAITFSTTGSTKTSPRHSQRLWVPRVMAVGNSQTGGWLSMKDQCISIQNSNVWLALLFPNWHWFLYGWPVNWKSIWIKPLFLMVNHRQFLDNWRPGLPVSVHKLVSEQSAKFWFRG